MYQHIAKSPKVGCALTLDQSTQDVKRWLADHNTHPDIQWLLLRYLCGRGSISCLECATDLNLPHIMQEMASSHDIIG
jgi:hypothetical protein